MNKILKWTLIISGLGIIAFLGFILYVIADFGGAFDTYYSKQDLIDNFNLKSKEIYELQNYINTIVPIKKSVDIEFEDNETLGIFHVTVGRNYDSNWGIKINSIKADTLLRKLHWTKETLKILKDKLDKANCISVRSGDPCNIGFKRSGMEKYYYNLFKNPIPDSLKNSYNDSCTYILFNEKVVLEHGGGAVGPQCF